MIDNQVLESLRQISENFPDVKVKQEFNFFSAIVSGKRKREHIEFYHSNFIAFLLDRSETHDLKNLFFDKLLERITMKGDDIPKQILRKIKNSLGDYEVEREKSAKGSIDIFIHSKEKWGIFIENKLRSYEGENQMLDYCGWTEEQRFYNWIGIYLTKEGIFPKTKNEQFDYGDRIVSISYLTIKDWLIDCLDLIDGQQQSIKIAIRQYISIITQELNLTEMENEKIIEEFLDQENSNTPKVISIFTTLKNGIEKYILSKRTKFLAALVQQLNEKLGAMNEIKVIEYKKPDNNNKAHKIICEYCGKNFEIKLDQAYPYFEDGGSGLWWGVYTTYNKDLIKVSGDRNWTGICLKDKEGKIIDDFSKNTDLGSALIVEASKNEELNKKLILNISENITKDLEKALNS